MKSNPSENCRKVTGDEQYKPLSSGCPKKTRDLPNLSKCQACDFRVDSCAGKARIRLLYSEWRVLLLCRRCFVRVESSKICSYCFKDASMEDCVRCCQCRRSVHSSCFQQYRNVPVGSGNSLPAVDSFICVDCWVPETIARKRRISKSERVDQHGMGLKPGDVRVSSSGDCAHLLEDIVNGGDGIHGKNVGAVKSRELGSRKTILEKNAVGLDHNVLDLETSEAESCESGQDRNLNHKVAVEMDRPKRNLRVYERTKWKYGNNLCKYNYSAKNPEEKLIDRNETSPARWINVYARNGWRGGKYLWITNDQFTKGEATTIKGQEACSTKLMNMYVKRGKNDKDGEKQSYGFQNEETELQGDGLEEAQERCSENSKCTEKLNDDSHNSNTKSAGLVALADEQEKVSGKLMKVYVRVRLKNSGCTRKHSGDYRNTEMRLEVEEGKYFHDLANSNTCDSDIKSVLRVCNNQGQS